MKNKINKSFYEWCLENNKQDYLKLWDYNLNNEKPEQVSYCSNLKYWFKCNRDIHKSYQKNLNNITSLRTKIECPECNSIGQYIIDNYGETYLKTIWSEKNKISPFEISKGSSKKKIWLKCQNNNTHPDYDLLASNFSHSHNCPYCSGKRVCLTNSLGYLYPEVVTIWSDKNKKSPYEYTSHSKQKVWWKCKNNSHEDYLREIDNSVTYNFNCHKCVKETHYNIENLVGKKFNYLTVKELDKERTEQGQGTYWFCDCDCGTKHKSILSSHLKSEKIQSCGCLWLSKISKENNHNWKGGITPERVKERNSLEYKRWIKRNYKKCFYTCQCCGKTKNIIKEMHHIYNFSTYKDLRYEDNNAILLCKECHNHSIPGSFHNTYGTLNNTPEQLEEYINNKRKVLGIDIPFTIESYLAGNILKPENVNKVITT